MRGNRVQNLCLDLQNSVNHVKRFQRVQFQALYVATVIISIAYKKKEAQER